MWLYRLDRFESDKVHYYDTCYYYNYDCDYYSVAVFYRHSIYSILCRQISNPCCSPRPWTLLVH